MTSITLAASYPLNRIHMEEFDKFKRMDQLKATSHSLYGLNFLLRQVSNVFLIYYSMRCVSILSASPFDPYCQTWTADVTEVFREAILNMFYVWKLV